MNEAGLGHTEANIPNMQRIIQQALKSESCSEKDILLQKLRALLNEMMDHMLENAFKM